MIHCILPALTIRIWEVSWWENHRQRYDAASIFIIHPENLYHTSTIVIVIIIIITSTLFTQNTTTTTIIIPTAMIKMTFTIEEKEK